MLEKILDLIYPPVCGICGKLDSNWLCNKCKIKLKYLYNLKIEDYINDESKYFDEHIYLFKYEGMIRDIIIDYKFKEKSYKYRSIVNFLLKYKNYCEILKNYDIIIPVPISKKRFKERGYNQSALFAKDISKKTELIYIENSLQKIKDNISQSKLNKQERKENAKNVYQLKNKDKLINKNILLIDDIYTTGSTVNECCRILKTAKPNKIGVLTITKD